MKNLQFLCRNLPDPADQKSIQTCCTRNYPNMIVPDDLITEILLRLPVKSLLKFKCVSKPWWTLISSKLFVQSQLDFATKEDAHHNVICTLIKKGGCPHSLRNFSLNSLLYNDTTYSTRLDYPTMKRSSDFEFVGHCNGLCCILIDNERFFLWNPATGKSKRVPPVFRLQTGVILMDYGFGFVENDYKIVVNLNVGSVAKLYSLSSNSWKDVPKSGLEELGLYIYDCYIAGKFANGKLHWVLSGWDFIVYFDLKSEVYHGAVAVPPSAAGSLEVLDTAGDYFALCTPCWYDDTPCTDVWILDSEMCWSKLVSIDWSVFQIDEGFDFIPVSIMQNGDILIAPRYWGVLDDVLIIFYPKTNSYRKCSIGNSDEIQLAKECRGIIRPCFYIQSLVSPFAKDHGLKGRKSAQVQAVKKRKRAAR